jgi:hypothetical protein
MIDLPGKVAGQFAKRQNKVFPFLKRPSKVLAFNFLG